MADPNTTLVNLNQSVDILQRVGFFNYALPMGIFFLILYGILEQYNVITKDKRVNALLSLLISAFIMLYAYVNELELFFANFYTRMSVALIILLFSLTFAIFAFKGLKNNGIIEGREKVWSSVLIVLSVLIVSSSFQNAPGEIGQWAADVSGLVMALGFLGALVAGFTNGKGPTAKGGE